MLRLIAAISILPVILTGCGSSGNAGLEPRGKLYRGVDVVEFLDDTSPPEIEPEYLIGVGDRLDIVFFVHRELTAQSLPVRTDGRITLPYVGDIAAAGFTPMELDSMLTVRFSEVLRDPNLSVIVRETAKKLVYVLGQVERPGGFPIDNRVSVLGAIALAGGFASGAKSDHVLVIRRNGHDKIVGAEINVASVTSGYNVANDIWLKNYDIVFVPKTRLRSVADFVEILNDIVYPIVDTGYRAWLLSEQVDVLFLQSN
jgi:polysaccharide export outer membrane protein